MTRKRSKTRKRVYCPDCKCVRLHDERVRKDGDLQYVLVWICRKCCKTTLAGGVCCKKCGGTSFKVPSCHGRYSRPGCWSRIRICNRCRTRYGTAERIERVL